MVEIEKDRKNRFRYLDKEGYIVVALPTGKLVTKYDGTTFESLYLAKEHRLMFEEKLGIKLPSEMPVHHRDSNRRNNRLLNFKVFLNDEKHTNFHHQEKKDSNFIITLLDCFLNISWLYYLEAKKAFQIKLCLIKCLLNSIIK